jgi:hypothetical protein
LLWRLLALGFLAAGFGASLATKEVEAGATILIELGGGKVGAVGGRRRRARGNVVRWR